MPALPKARTLTVNGGIDTAEAFGITLLKKQGRAEKIRAIPCTPLSDPKVTASNLDLTMTIAYWLKIIALEIATLNDTLLSSKDASKV